MSKSRSFFLSSLLVAPFFLFLYCSTKNSTDLGAGIIRDKFPNEYHTYSMKAFEGLGSVTLPQLPTDSGFGIHQVGGAPVGTGPMMIGDSNGEHSGGFARIMIPLDTSATRFFDALDTFRSLVLVVHRDSIIMPESLQIWKSNSTLHALQPSTAAGDSLLGSIFLHRNDSVKTDSLHLPPGPFAQSIFTACTTSNKLALQDSIGLIFTNLNQNLVRIQGNPQLLVGFKRGNNDTTRFISYGVNGSRGWDFSRTYYIASSATDSLPLSYAPKRTLVYKFDPRVLWDSLRLFPQGTRAQFIKATFSLHRPDAGPTDSLIIQYVLSDTLVRNGVRLDTMFARDFGQDIHHDPGAVALYGGAADNADVRISVQSIKTVDSLRLPDTLYLYLRLAEDSKQIWKKASFTQMPRLQATIAAH